MPDKLLFLTLKVFSSTGGIEKMNRVAGKALYETYPDIKIFSSHDKNRIDKGYFPSEIFFAFNGNKLRFALKSIAAGLKSRIVILSHINLLSIGFCIKILSPKTRLVLFAHGIETWRPMSNLKKKMLSACDRIFAVSNFTKDTLEKSGNVRHGRSIVLNNCLDPNLEEPDNWAKSEELLSRYGLTKQNFVLLTITRLCADEQYKGYDKVLMSLKELVIEYPELRYLIIGKYDAMEKERIDNLIASMNLNAVVIFGGYIADEELMAHYNLADVYIMPSVGEGFGIVFIEAMFYKLPVIAGNKDGSPDALLNGKLGILVNPDRTEEITSAIKRVVNNRQAFLPDHKLLLQHFGYQVYKEKMESELKKLIN